MTPQSGTRYTLEEIVTLHSLEQDFREVLVEGRTDAALISYFLSRLGVSAEIYAVTDRVEIDFDASGDNGDFGERTKVIAVARRLDRDFPAGSTITCVVDADYWRTLEAEPENLPRSLLITDHASMDSYLFDERIFDKLLRVTLRAGLEVSSVKLMRGIQDALVSLFVVRWLLKNHASSPPMVAKMEKRLKVASSALTVDVSSLLQDCLSGNGVPRARTVVQDEMLPEYEKLLSSLRESDPRDAMNGHDIARTLCLLLDRLHPNLFREDRAGFKDPDTMTGLLRGCAEPSWLSQERFFEQLISRLTRT